MAMTVLSIRRNGRIRLILTGVIILLAGLVVAAMVYMTTGDGTGDAVGNQNVERNAYAIAPHDSKQNLSDLENAGGQAAVIADDFNFWVADLWHGRRLAYTVAVLSILVSLACFLAANLLFKPPSHDQDEDQDC